MSINRLDPPLDPPLGPTLGPTLFPGFGDTPPTVPFRPRDVRVSPSTIHRLTHEGHLRRLLRGVYVGSEVPDTLSLRARALALVVPTGAVVTDRSAAWLHGVDLLLPDETERVPPVSVFHNGRGCRVRRDGTRSGQRTMPLRDVMTIDGVRVTTPLRTALDLGRLQHRDRSFASLDAFLRAGVDKDDLLGAIPRFAGYRGVCQLRAFAPLADGRAASPAESITRLRWIDTTTPYPELQIPVTGERGVTWWLDLGVKQLFFAVEYDGIAFHSTPEQQAHDRARRDWLMANTPWHIEVVRRENIFGAKQDFDFHLKGWLRDARRTLGERLTRGDWTAFDLGAQPTAFFNHQH